MQKEQQTYQLQDIEFRIVYSRRRTLGISILPDSTVIIRAPLRTTLKTIGRIVEEKASWIIKHRDKYRQKESTRLNGPMAQGEDQLFRGQKCEIHIIHSKRPFARFKGNIIELGLEKSEDREEIRKILYKGLKREASGIFPGMIAAVLKKHEDRKFQPTGLIIRSMKSRWGSCSRKGIITLSTELIKLSDIYIEYVILHELCHLKHHNHGSEFYKLLSEVFPDWKKIRKDLRGFIH